jgi:3-oxosteroid 1-dehydrogenase
VTEMTVDVLVLGSGAGGLVSALTAKELGLQALVVERSVRLGGSSALSGGGIWLPCNPLLESSGVTDTPELARQYLAAAVGDAGPSASPERQAAFVEGALDMSVFLQRRRVRLVHSWHPDYYAQLPGGLNPGRSVESDFVDGRPLGSLLALLPPRAAPLVTLSRENGGIYRATRSFANFRTLVRAALRTISARLRGEELLSMGRGLVGQLLLEIQREQIQVWTESVAAEPIVENGRIVAMTVIRGGEATLVRVRRGVLIATGGFARNAAMREQYSPKPVAAAWTMANMGDQGDGIKLGMSLGGVTALMDEAWWMPAFHMPPSGRVQFAQYERSLPGSIIVDSAGKRFFNEGVPYMEVGQWMLQHHNEVPAVPSWLIFDRTYRRRYVFGARPPWITPRSWTKSGMVKTAGSISGLAAQCGIDADGLNGTVARFNEFARSGRDDDFHRGEVPYDLHNGDPTNKPNPCLGPLLRAPFYAVPIYPGDVGTCGGLLTDQHARVLTDEGAPITGLYATGNATAPVSGTVYPGAGMSIAASMVFGRRAVQHMTTLEQLDRPQSIQTVSS